VSERQQILVPRNHVLADSVICRSRKSHQVRIRASRSRARRCAAGAITAQGQQTNRSCAESTVGPRLGKASNRTRVVKRHSDADWLAALAMVSINKLLRFDAMTLCYGNWSEDIVGWQMLGKGIIHGDA